jgi:WD40 repeat protein
MLPSPRVRQWTFRLGAGLLLPLLVVGAYYTIPPGPRVSLTLRGDEHVIRVSPDGTTLVTHDGNLISSDWGPEPGTLRLWDLRTGQPGPVLEGADDVSDFDLCLSPDGGLICGKQEPATLKTWDVATGKRLGRWEPDVEGVRRVCRGFTPDGRLVVLERYGEHPFKPEAVEFWDADLQTARATLPGQSLWDRLDPGRGTSIQWRSDGRRFAAYHRTAEGKIDRLTLCDLAEADPVVRPVVDHAVSAEEVALSPDLGAFVTLDRRAGRGAESVLTLRDTASGAVLASGLGFDPDGRLEWMDFDLERRRLTLVVDGRVDGGWTIIRTDYDLNTGERVRHQFRGDHSRLSPDRRWIAESTDGGALDLWDTRAGERCGRLQHPGDVWGGGGGPVFSADSRLLLVPGLGREASQVVALRLRPSLRSPLDVTRSSAVGRVWDVESRREVCAIPDCHERFLSRDGKTLVAVGCCINNVKVWDVPPRKSWGLPVAAGAVLWAVALVGCRVVRRAWRRLVSPPAA